VRPFSPREKSRMRRAENQGASILNSLTPTLSLRVRELSGTAVGRTILIMKKISCYTKLA
jgi:hypothetical protein